MNTYESSVKAVMFHLSNLAKGILMEFGHINIL